MKIKHAEARFGGGSTALKKRLHELDVQTSAKQNLVELTTPTGSILLTFATFDSIREHVEKSRSQKGQSLQFKPDSKVRLRTAHHASNLRVNDPKASGAFSIYPISRFFHAYQDCYPHTKAQQLMRDGSATVRNDAQAVQMCASYNTHKINDFLEEWGSRPLRCPMNRGTLHVAFALKFDMFHNNALLKTVRGIRGLMHPDVVEFKVTEGMSRVFQLPCSCEIEGRAYEVYVQRVPLLEVGDTYERDMKLSSLSTNVLNVIESNPQRRKVSLWLPVVPSFKLETDSVWMKSLAVKHREERLTVYTMRNLYQVNMHYKHVRTQGAVNKRQLRMTTPFIMVVRDPKLSLPVAVVYVTDDMLEGSNGKD